MTLAERIKSQLVGAAYETFVTALLPDGKREGREWVARNPNRHDRNPGSFKINLDNHRWADFATDDTGNDAIDLYAYLRTNGDNARAIRELAKIADYARANTPPVVPAETPSTPRYRPVIPVPASAGNPPVKGPSWTYYDADGRKMFHVERVSKTTGGKDFIPWTYAADADGACGWRRKAIPDQRPLYNVHLIEGRRILVVEGEKTADHAGALTDRHVVTWSGGANAVQKTDWTPLIGLDVVIWPDADEAGVNAARRISDILGGVPIVDVTGLPEAWDLADWSPDAGVNVAALIDRALARHVPPEVIPPEVTPPPTATAPLIVAPFTASALAGVEFAPLDKQTLVPVLPHWRWSKPNKAGESDPTTPIATIENVTALFQHLGVSLKYNVISKQEELVIPGKRFTLDNEGTACLAWVKSIQSRIGMATTHLGEYLTNIADENAYNPVVDWVTLKPWDGVDRLPDFFNTLTVVDETLPNKPSVDDVKKARAAYVLKSTIMRRWMISAIAAAFEPRGIAAQGMIVLQGDQYLGKTAWIKSLAPPDLKLIADGMLIHPDDKDSVSAVIQFWIVELGEVDAMMRKVDIAQLKAFITRGFDLFRRAFAPRDSKFSRRTVFAASVNPHAFLKDPTGNRRFWTLSVEAVNHAHGLDMQQIWAQFHALYVAGERWWMDADEMAMVNQSNEAHTERDPVEEKIAHDLLWDAPPNEWRYMTATRVLGELGQNFPKHGDKMKATSAAERLAKIQFQKWGVNPTKGGGTSTIEGGFYRVGTVRRTHRGLTEIFVPPKRRYTLQ